MHGHIVRTPGKNAKPFAQIAQVSCGAAQLSASTACKAGSPTCATPILGDCASMCWTHRCAGRKKPATRLRYAQFFAVPSSLCHNTACLLQPMFAHQAGVLVLLCSGCLLCCYDGCLAHLHMYECPA
jgi:hypothetical protein